MANDPLSALLADLSEAELTEIASRGRHQAARLAHMADGQAWSRLFSLLATAAEAALLRKQTGMPV
jgi:hypothetical protein